MSDARRARIAELKRLNAVAESSVRANNEEIRRLAMEVAADMVAQLTGRERELFVTGSSKGLTAGEQSHTVNSSMMTAVHKVAISAGRKKKDAFLNAIRAKGYTMRGLATALDVPVSLISMYRSGDRPIPRDRAERIEALTGWPAAAKSWPGGVSG